MEARHNDVMRFVSCKWAIFLVEKEYNQVLIFGNGGNNTEPRSCSWPGAASVPVIHSFNKYLLSIYYVPGTVLGIEEAVVRPCHGPYSSEMYSLKGAMAISWEIAWFTS